MPAHPEAKPEIADDVVGNVASSSVEQKCLRIASAINAVEYTADQIVEDELSAVAKQLPVEVEAFLKKYTSVHEYIVAAYFFGSNSWN